MSWTILPSHIKIEKPTMALWFNGCMSIEGLTAHCLDVYFADSYTDAQLIIVATYLFWLFRNRVPSLHALAERENHSREAELCRVALETTLSRLPLHIPHTFHYVLALSLGVSSSSLSPKCGLCAEYKSQASYALEIAKPSLAWTITSRASELCQSLGFHRLSTMKDDSEAMKSDKISLFWTIYILEKGLALRLGRSSTIQDYDVTVPCTFKTSGTNRLHQYDQYFTSWIKMAKIQGCVYENLYSPKALSMEAQTRQTHANLLIQEMEVLYHSLEDIRVRLNLSFVQPSLSTTSNAKVILSKVFYISPKLRLQTESCSKQMKSCICPS